MSRIAIVGAGASGLAAAWALRTEPVEVTVFEKSRGHSGRAATRGRYGMRYDHGANYISPSSDRVTALITRQLPTDDLVDIEKAVWSFDADGTVSPQSDDGPKWTYRRGISTLGKLLARASSATVLTETRIASLRHKPDATWRLMSEENDAYGPFDVVVLTPPAPQTSSILQESDLDDALRTTLTGGVDDASYCAQFTYVYAYERTVKRPGDCYGLVNADGGHSISWISYEHDKPGHVPDGSSLLVVQTAPKWTASRVDADPDSFTSDVKSMAADVLEVNLKRPDWYDTQRWRYSMPTEPADTDRLDAGRNVGLFFCGDYVVGKGRVGDALASGLDTATDIRTFIS